MELFKLVGVLFVVVGFILSTIFKISISSLFKNMRSLRLTVFQLFTRKVISTKAILIFVFIYIMCSGNQVRNMEKDMIYYIQKYKSENLNYDKD